MVWVVALAVREHTGRHQWTICTGRTYHTPPEEGRHYHYHLLHRYRPQPLAASNNHRLPIHPVEIPPRE